MDRKEGIFEGQELGRLISVMQIVFFQDSTSEVTNRPNKVFAAERTSQETGCI